MFTLFTHCQIHWLEQVHRMTDRRIPKDLLYSELASGKRGPGRPLLCFKNICKWNMKALDIDVNCCEELTSNQSLWKQELGSALKSGEARRQETVDERRAWL